MSQVDPAVFAELPPDVAAELALALPPSHAAFFSEGNIPPDPGSPLPVGAEIGAAPQSDARAKAAAKVIPAVLESLTARKMLLHWDNHANGHIMQKDVRVGLREMHDSS